MHQSKLPIAIISANAYDRSLDNQAKIPAQDFFVKPVNLDEVLDWIGNQLGLTWRYADHGETQSAPALAQPVAVPDVEPIPATLLENLAQFARMGYVKGVREVLATLNRDHAQHQIFINALQQAMERFDFAKLQRLIEEYTE